MLVEREREADVAEVRDMAVVGDRTPRSVERGDGIYAPSPFVERAHRRFGSAPEVIVSGGYADVLAARLSVCGVPLAIEHNLVLGGLALRARTTDHGSI